MKELAEEWTRRREKRSNSSVRAQTMLLLLFITIPILQHLGVKFLLMILKVSTQVFRANRQGTEEGI